MTPGQKQENRLIPSTEVKSGNTHVLILVCAHLGLACWDTSPYLTVLHSLAEEAVQQQVLQLAVSVERLFDLTQEDAMEGGMETRVQLVFQLWSTARSQQAFQATLRR